MEDDGIRNLVVGVIVVGVVAGAWLFRDAWMPAEPPPEPEPVTEPAEPAAPLEPLHPVDPIEPRAEGGELIPLPSLEDSDEYFGLALVDLFGADLEGMLADELLIERAVGTTDNLARNRVPERIRPVGRLPGRFTVDGVDETTGLYISPDNYERYDDVVTMFEDAAVSDMLDTYRRFYPLLNEAYRMLGYPDGHFNDRVVEVVDLLLDTPEPDEPIELIHEKVLYEFRDPELEALSGGQKMLLRMGPVNAKRVKASLRALRAELATASEPD